MHKHLRAIFLAIVLTLTLMSLSWARQADGTLGLIRYPISTNPILGVPGSNVTLQLANEHPVTSVRVELYTKDKSITIFQSAPGQAYKVEDRSTFGDPSPKWSTRPKVTRRDLVRVPITLPKDIAEGFYGLRVKCSAGEDTSERAVRIFKEWPAKYDICHITDTHIGKKDMPNTEGIFQKVADRVNQDKPAFVLITGDNVDNSLPDEHRLFLSVLDQFQVPTFVIPGNHDSYGYAGDEAVDVISFLGDGYYSFDFGKNRYIGIEAVAGKFDDEQQKFIEDHLAAVPLGSFKCIFSHDEYDKMRPWLNEVLEKYKVNLYLYGHHHQNRVDFQPDGLTSVLTDAGFTRHGFYNIITIENGKVKSVNASSGQTETK